MTAQLADWRQAFRDADALPVTATPAEKATRGRQLERILSAMFDEAGLQPRLSYRPKGEEVDGSIWLYGRTVLIEAKWTGDAHPASSLYQFKGKVDGKLVGTLGLFISVGGFSEDSVDALVAGKELNLILADGDDLRAIAEGQISIVDALDRKLRAAGDAGTPFLPLVASAGSPQAAVGQHIVVVEGASDARLLEAVRRTRGAVNAVTFVPAAGPMNMVPVARVMLEVADSIGALTVIVDGDLDSRVVDKLAEEISLLASDYDGEITPQVVAVAPDLEVALGLSDPTTDHRSRRRYLRVSDAELDELLSSVDLAALAREQPTLGTALAAIGVDFA
jgi:hypothetical protein